MSQFGTIHVDKPLTNLLIGYHPTGMIGDKVAPVISTKSQSDKYYIASKDNFRVEDYTRKSGARAKEVLPLTLSTDTFYSKRYSLSKPITDDDMANSDTPPIQLKQLTQRRLKTKLMLKRDIDLAAKLFNTSNFSGKTSALTGDDRWDANNGATSYPIDVVLEFAETILKNSGKKPNVVIMGKQVARVLQTHPQLTNYVSANVDKKIVYSKMAEMFDVNEVIVGEVPYNSIAEGLTAVNSFVWGKYFLLAYINPTPMIDEPSLMYSFRWKASHAGGNSMYTKTWREEAVESDFIEVNINYDDKIISNDCGYLLSTVIS